MASQRLSRRAQQHLAATVMLACRDVAAALDVVRGECEVGRFEPATEQACRELLARGLRHTVARLDGWLACDDLDELSRRRCVSARREADELCQLLRVSA